MSSPNPNNLVTEEEQYLQSISEFNDRGRVFISGTMNELMSEFSAKQFLDAKENSVEQGRNYTTIVIDSSGGLITTLHRLVYCMHTFRPSKAGFRYIGYATVHASSAAFDLLQHCDWRVAHPGTYFIAHYGIISMSNYDQAMLYENSSEALNYHRRRVEGVLDLYEQRSKLSRSDIHNLCKAESKFTAVEALEYGFIDEIIHVAPSVIPQRPNFSLHDDAL